MQSDDLAAPTRPLTALAWQLAALLILRGTQNEQKCKRLLQSATRHVADCMYIMCHFTPPAMWQTACI